MIRTKGEAGTGNIVEAVTHMRAGMDAIRQLVNMPQDELMARAKELGAPFELVEEVRRMGKLPVVNFAAGGMATPADAALMMRLGADGVFVGSGIFNQVTLKPWLRLSSKLLPISGMQKSLPGLQEPRRGYARVRYKGDSD